MSSRDIEMVDEELERLYDEHRGVDHRGLSSGEHPDWSSRSARYSGVHRTRSNRRRRGAISIASGTESNSYAMTAASAAHQATEPASSTSELQSLPHGSFNFRNPRSSQTPIFPEFNVDPRTVDYVRVSPRTPRSVSRRHPNETAQDGHSRRRTLPPPLPPRPLADALRPPQEFSIPNSNVRNDPPSPRLVERMNARRHRRTLELVESMSEEQIVTHLPSILPALPTEVITALPRRILTALPESAHVLLPEEIAITLRPRRSARLRHDRQSARTHSPTGEREATGRWTTRLRAREAGRPNLPQLDTNRYHGSNVQPPRERRRNSRSRRSSVEIADDLRRDLDRTPTSDEINARRLHFLNAMMEALPGPGELEQLRSRLSRARSELHPSNRRHRGDIFTHPDDRNPTRVRSYTEYAETPPAPRPDALPANSPWPESPSPQPASAEQARETKDCTICQYPVPSPPKWNRVTCARCDAWFHPHCLRQWVRESGSCPLCRGFFTLASVRGGRGASALEAIDTDT